MSTQTEPTVAELLARVADLEAEVARLSDQSAVAQREQAQTELADAKAAAADFDDFERELLARPGVFAEFLKARNQRLSDMAAERDRYRHQRDDAWERIVQLEADRDRLAAQLAERAGYVEQHRPRLAKVAEDRPEGEPSTCSQTFLRDIDGATPEELRAEVRRLDLRLRWMHDHLDGDATAGLLVAWELADQRDKAADDRDWLADMLAKVRELRDEWRRQADGPGDGEHWMVFADALADALGAADVGPSGSPSPAPQSATSEPAEEHDFDWIGFVEADDEYAARCLCGWRTTAWAEDVAEESLQQHIDAPEERGSR